MDGGLVDASDDEASALAADDTSSSSDAASSSVSAAGAGAGTLTRARTVLLGRALAPLADNAEVDARRHTAVRTAVATVSSIPMPTGMAMGMGATASMRQKTRMAGTATLFSADGTMDMTGYAVYDAGRAMATAVTLQFATLPPRVWRRLLEFISFAQGMLSVRVSGFLVDEEEGIVLDKSGKDVKFVECAGIKTIFKSRCLFSIPPC